MAEIGLMREAGCVYVTDADRPIVDSRVMRRLLAYAGGLGVLVAHRPADPWLTDGAAATESEFAGRMGLAAAPAAAETIMLERDIALVELTGARLLVDQISAAAPLESLARAKAAGLPILATASINHLTFNELDIGDYRTFWKLVPPLRGEDDRQALIEALASRPGGHRRLRPRARPRPRTSACRSTRPRPARSAWRPCCRPCSPCTTKGACPSLRLIETVTLAPAKAIGLDAGRLAVGAPGRPGALRPRRPARHRRRTASSPSRKNSAFDGRRLQGEVLMTLVDGRIVYDARSNEHLMAFDPHSRPHSSSPALSAAICSARSPSA